MNAPLSPELGIPQLDPAKVVGHETCAKCHTQEVQQWMATPHYATFDTLHRTPAAKEIARRLGFRSVKRNETCIKCHYTQQEESARVRTVSGVSCESCHGAARDWVDSHADYGGPAINRANESPAHRRQRITRSVAAGMNNPANVYLIARQCYSCHTVPDEDLVNVGGHQAGSHEFELVAWSQGKVRHNFVRSGGAANQASSPAQLRLMYVVGVMADLEYSLRATAQATEKATFALTSAERAARMKSRLWQIQRTIADPHIAEALDAVATVELRLGNAAAINAAANAVGHAAYTFANQADGHQLAALDPLLPDPRTYK